MFDSLLQKIPFKRFGSDLLAKLLPCHYHLCINGWRARISWGPPNTCFTCSPLAWCYASLSDSTFFSDDWLMPPFIFIFFEWLLPSTGRCLCVSAVLMWICLFSGACTIWKLHPQLLPAIWFGWIIQIQSCNGDNKLNFRIFQELTFPLTKMDEA